MGDSQEGGGWRHTEVGWQRGVGGGIDGVGGAWLACMCCGGGWGGMGVREKCPPYAILDHRAECPQSPGWAARTFKL